MLLVVWLRLYPLISKESIILPHVQSAFQSLPQERGIEVMLSSAKCQEHRKSAGIYIQIH